MTHPPCGRPVLFVGAAIAVIALFLGLAAGPASAGPEVNVRVPSGNSDDPGPKPSKESDARKDKQGGESAKPGSTARTGKKATTRPHDAKGPASGGGGKHSGGPKASSASHHEEADNDKAKDKDKDKDKDQNSPAGGPNQDEPVDTPPTSAQPVPATTTPSTAPLSDPDRDIRTLSSGSAGITTILASAPADPAGVAPAAEGEADAQPDAVIGGALDPPLLGAGPPPSRWAPFVPALDEPAFPAILIAALALFLALFGRGDRRDPKLVEAVVDDRAQDVDFS